MDKFLKSPLYLAIDDKTDFHIKIKRRWNKFLKVKDISDNLNYSQPKELVKEQILVNVKAAMKNIQKYIKTVVFYQGFDINKKCMTLIGQWIDNYYIIIFMSYDFKHNLQISIEFTIRKPSYNLFVPAGQPDTKNLEKRDANILAKLRNLEYCISIKDKIFTGLRALGIELPYDYEIVEYSTLLFLRWRYGQYIMNFTLDLTSDDVITYKIVIGLDLAWCHTTFNYINDKQWCIESIDDFISTIIHNLSTARNTLVNNVYSE